MAKHDRIVRDGKVFYSIPETARMLKTSANKVRDYMGDGSLEWIQFETNGRLYVTAESLIGLKQKTTK